MPQTIQMLTISILFLHNAQYRQPMETLKTLTQVKTKGQSSSLFATATNLYSTAGIRGFYRGGVPLLLGGGLMVRHYNIVPRIEICFLCNKKIAYVISMQI